MAEKPKNPFTDVGGEPKQTTAQLLQFLRDVKEFRVGAGDTSINMNNQEGLWIGAEKFADAPFAIDLLGNLLAGGVTVQTGTFNFTSPSGNQAITGLGFQPSMLIMFALGQGTTQPSSWGFTSGVAQNQCMYHAANNEKWAIDRLIRLRDAESGATRTTQANLVSFDSDGFTINWSISGTAYDGKAVFVAFR